jgi:hypothetical protein
VSKASKSEDRLIELIAGFRHDPLGFVLASYPWGEPGELRDQTGPRQWQREVLEDIGAKLRDGATVHQAIQVATSSGHGIGKSALVSWTIHWALSTCPDSKVVVTANTEAQLRTKTWPEVSKWMRLAINSHWWEVTATAIFSKDKAHEKTWRADAVPWSEHNTEAFAGLHNQGRRIVLIFDEASAIADKVWEVAEGALTDEGTEIIWAAFGNPTRNTGRFRECFGRLRHRWITRQIDSRTVAGTNKTQIAKWVEDYGEDSDFVRVRVRGLFPRAGSMQFINSDDVGEAARREAVSQMPDPLIMGIDVARFGDDQSVIVFRRGRDARTLKPRKFRGTDTMTLAGVAAGLIGEMRPDAVFIDETGIGGAVVDRLRQLGHQVIGVNNGAVSDVPVEGELVANKGAELWARMRQWLRTGGAIANDPELMAELEGREYGFNQHNEIRLERKEDMKKRGLSSPDNADALSLTFAYPVGPRRLPNLPGQTSDDMNRALTDYDPFA